MGSTIQSARERRFGATAARGAGAAGGGGRLGRVRGGRQGSAGRARCGGTGREPDPGGAHDAVVAAVGVHLDQAAA